MEIFAVKSIIEKSRAVLAGKNTRSLAALHAGVTVVLSLLVTLLQYVLAQGIGNTSGLSGMGTRSVLETAQTVLQWANTLLIPFWNLGFLYAALLWARDSYARKEDLLMGFRRIGPCIGLMLNRFVLSFCVMFLCANVCSGIMMMTPAADGLLELVAEAGNDINAFYALLEQQDTAALISAMAPLLIVWGILCVVILVPLLYRFRFAEYAVLNHPGVRGLPAMLISAALLRRRCWKLFKIDLHFWWYYVLQLLCMLLVYADVLLVMLGVDLPIQGDLAYLVFYVLYLAAYFCVLALFRPRVETAYACAYEQMMEMGPVQKKNQTVPQKMPWDSRE